MAFSSDSASDSAAPALLLDVLAVVRRHRRLISRATVAALLVSALVALRLPNLYPATTTFYASDLQTSDPDQLASGERKVTLTPLPEDLDRAVNIGQSQPVLDYLIDRFHLASHYQYDSSATPEARQEVRLRLLERLDLAVTDRDVVELTVLDTDPVLAARLANALVARIDTVNVALTRPNRQRVVSVFSDKYLALSRSYGLLSDSLLAARRRYGISGLDREGRYLAKLLIEKQAELVAARLRNAPNASSLAAEVQALSQLPAPGAAILTREGWLQGSSLVQRLQVEQQALATELGTARAAVEVAKANLTQRLSTIYVLQPATPGARKVKPIRWLIVAASTLGVFLLTTLAALLLDFFGQPGAVTLSDEAETPARANEPRRQPAAHG